VDLETTLTTKLKSIENMVYDNVPISKDEADNAVISTWGHPSDLKVDGKTLGHLHHHDIMRLLDIVEFERG
jgi:seryl-tRNA synthetase